LTSNGSGFLALSVVKGVGIGSVGARIPLLVSVLEVENCSASAKAKTVQLSNQRVGVTTVTCALKVTIWENEDDCRATFQKDRQPAFLALTKIQTNTNVHCPQTKLVKSTLFFAVALNTSSRKL
jgi:hypothetical protein